MFFRVRHQKMVYVYLLILILLSILVALGAMIAYHALLREQRFQIEAAVAKLTSGGGDKQQFCKCIINLPSRIVYYYIFFDCHVNYFLSICFSKSANLQYSHRHNSIPSIDDNQKPLVIYNRVPKTGSTSFVNVAYDLHSHNSFHVLHVNITGNSHLLPIYDQVCTVMIFFSRLQTPYKLCMYLCIIKCCFSFVSLIIHHVGCDPRFIMVILLILTLKGIFNNFFF